MELTLNELSLVKEALGYGLLFSKSEAETAEFALLKMKVEKNLFNDFMNTGQHLRSQVATGLPASTSLDGCPFHYCDKKPFCEGKCRYNNGNAG
ncbi:hypothetical protein BCY91_14070 [Pelobium manganitolerans]|uniref:Uncharacterized protein n=1 Tax=Pelobium manganitolerans TaxID=1842495 RepID=A0A419S9U1_9SPHI|nr:hypothetical protein [Pelobium manganitolerans]RKD18999.1 hypothetical protein BCY91_14070 [Pelobium manganitolerans]